jgi:hypothetical protein
MRGEKVFADERTLHVDFGERRISQLQGFDRHAHWDYRTRQWCCDILRATGPARTRAHAAFASSLTANEPRQVQDVVRPCARAPHVDNVELGPVEAKAPRGVSRKRRGSKRASDSLTSEVPHRDVMEDNRWDE